MCVTCSAPKTDTPAQRFTYFFYFFFGTFPPPFILGLTRIRKKILIRHIGVFWTNDFRTFFLAICFRSRVVAAKVVIRCECAFICTFPPRNAKRSAFVIYFPEKIAILCSPIVRNYFWPDKRFLSFSLEYGETVFKKVF